MPGDYPPGSSGGAWGQRAERPRGRPGGPMNAPGASGRRPVPPPGRSGQPRAYGAPGASGARWAPGPYRGAGAPGAQGYDPFAASMPGEVARTSAHLEAIQRKRNGFALFHDGNAGHLWRGEVASLFGESVLGVGVIIWLAYLTSSPVMVSLGVLSLGLPWLVAIPLAPLFENAREPGRPLAWIGRLRVLAALGVVGMHFVTIYPVLFGLLFVIGLAGRIRQALRVAATRVCLEPGEIELVSNDLFAGSALATIIGPLLAAALFMALGERVILVALVAAALFLLASNSDGFLDALPNERRAFSLATLTSATPDEATRADLIAAARGARMDGNTDGDEDEEPDAGEATDSESASLPPDLRERALPEWYQQGPKNPSQAIGDTGAGLGLAGGRAASATALLILATLAFVGGGLSVLEVFYVSDRLGLAFYYLGVLIALEAGGMAVGALLAETPPARAMSGALALLGLTLTGVALALLALTTIPLVSYGIAPLMGVANGVSVISARRLLRAGHDGAERRALSAAEAFLTALTSAAGAILFAFFFAGFTRASIGTHALLPGMPVGLILSGAGVGLALAGAILFIRPGLRERTPKSPRAGKNASLETSGRMGAAPGASGRFASPIGASGKMDAVGATGATGAIGALWDGIEDDDEVDAYAGEDEYGDGDDYDDYDDDDNEDEWDDRGGRGRGRGAPRRGGRPPSGPRMSSRDHRGHR